MPTKASLVPNDAQQNHKHSKTKIKWIMWRQL